LYEMCTSCVTNIGDQITTDELDGTNEAPHCLAIDATADD
jgi:hypothetical protein